MKRFDPIIAGAFDIAQSHALKGRHTELDVYHLLLGLIKHPKSSSKKILKTSQAKIEEKLKALSVSPTPMRPSSKLSEWITRAAEIKYSLVPGLEKTLEQTETSYCPNYFPTNKHSLRKNFER